VCGPRAGRQAETNPVYNACVIKEGSNGGQEDIVDAGSVQLYPDANVNQNDVMFIKIF
jgi:hypothetical protein